MVANVTAEQIEAKKSRVAEALRLHDEGLSIKQTAERMGVAHETVRRYLRANGVPFVKKPTNKGTRKLPCGTMKHCPAFMRMLISDGVGTAEIAAALGCTASTVSNFKSRHGLSDSRKRLGRDDLDEIVARAESGESYYSIAADFGTTQSHISTIAIRNGIRRGKGGGCVARNNAARSSKAAPKRMARVRDAIGESFEVVRETRKDWFLLRCRECGHEFERYVDLHCKTECPECHRREVERNERERKMAQMRRALVRALRGMLRAKEREEREREFLDTIHVCKECGKRFTMRELHESNPWNFSDNPTFCCTSCRNRWHRREGRHRRRERGEQKGYGNVSLLALEERDNHTCYLCGTKTDRSDYRVDESGNFIAGPSYPSIDHVVPLSKGGTHDMSNVRLACCRCNAIKGNRDVSEAIAELRAS